MVRKKCYNRAEKHHRDKVKWAGTMEYIVICPYALPLFCGFTFARPGLLPGRCSGWLCDPPQVCVVQWAPAHTQSRPSLTVRWDLLRWSLSQLSERSSTRSYDSTYMPVNHLQNAKRQDVRQPTKVIILKLKLKLFKSISVNWNKAEIE